MNLSIRFFMAATAYVAVAMAAFYYLTRVWVALLTTVTLLIVASAILNAILSARNRHFWTGFAVFSLIWFFFYGRVGMTNDFFTTPSVAAEYLAGPSTVYHDLHENEDPHYDGWSGASYLRVKVRTAKRRRYRGCGNVVATMIVGLMGGTMAAQIARNNSPIEKEHLLTNGGMAAQRKEKG